MRVQLQVIVGTFLAFCCLACNADETGAEYSKLAASQNAVAFVEAVFLADEPSVSTHMIYSGVGSETEWLTQLKKCLHNAGIVVSSRNAVAYQDNCEDELLGDASAPSAYYASLRKILPHQGLSIGESSVSTKDTDNQHYIVRVDVTGGHIQLFHILERAQEDLGLIRVDYIEVNGIRHEVENAIGDVELQDW